jgi:hypothetical protein
MNNVPPMPSNPFDVLNENTDSSGFPYVAQMISLLEAGPVKNLVTQTGKSVEFYGHEGSEADLLRYFARRPEMGEDTQSLLDNIDLLDEDYPSGLGISFSNLVLQIDDDEVDFVIGLKSER